MVDRKKLVVCMLLVLLLLIVIREAINLIMSIDFSLAPGTAESAGKTAAMQALSRNSGAI